MIKRLDLKCKRICSRLKGRESTVATFVLQTEKPSGFGSIHQKTVEAPVGEIERVSAVSHGERERPEVGHRPFANDVLFRLHRERPARPREVVANHGPQAPVAEEEIPLKAFGEPILVVTDPLSPSPADSAVNDRQRAVGSAQELARITVMAADDVVRQTIRPLLAIVIVAIGENVVLGGERHGERISLPGRDDFEIAAVGPNADHPAPLEMDGRTVRADGLGNSLIADGNVEKSVHAEPDTRCDVVVDAVERGVLRS